MAPTLRLPWHAIETVLLDMDGTLLDLYFDWRFWWEYLPQQYAKHHQLPLETAQKKVREAISAQQGTLNWYCTDYWSEVFELPVATLKHDLKHMIQPHPRVETFLSRLKLRGKRLALVTNAHRDSLALWRAIAQDFPYNPAHTLLIDDNLKALESAKAHGIRYLLAASHVSPHMPPVKTEHFPTFSRFEEIMP